MSQKNVDLLLASVAAYNAGDLDAQIEFFAPDIEAIPDPGFPEARPLHGRQELRRWFEDLGKAWMNARWETKEIRSLGPDLVLERGEWGGMGVGSGIEIGASYTAITTIRNGQICRVQYYADHDAALKAAGLED